jgi:protein gp37
MLTRVKPTSLVVRPPFCDLFAIDAVVRKAIKESMQADGFDESKPINVWDQEGVVVDGHTRLEIAVELGLKTVPVCRHSFQDEDHALGYAIANQRNRRNLEAGEILRCVAALGRKRNGRPGKTSSVEEVSQKGIPEIAKTLGVGHATVERVRSILDSGDRDIRKAVEKGEMSIRKAAEEVQKRKKEEAPQQRFNRTNSNVDWAWWTWNPVTGCKHDCVYCYARDIAVRFYPEKFEPTFRPERLTAATNTPLPKEAETDIGAKSVFVCSMADLFGRWVPKAWIQQVLDVARDNPQWNFLFLTKFPQRYPEFEFPKNSWCGATIDIQKRVEPTLKALTALDKVAVRWISCEPMLEPIEFDSLRKIDWIVIGGSSESTQTPAFSPPWPWVERVFMQTRKDKCSVYFKPNLNSVPKEYPGCVPVEFKRAPFGVKR